MKCYHNKRLITLNVIKLLNLITLRKNNTVEVAYEAGVTFDNSFFDNCFVFLRQCKDRSFLGSFTVHKKVKIRINPNQILSCFTSINVFFDFSPTLYWSKRTLIEVKQDKI